MQAVVCVCLTPNVAYTEWPQAKLLDIAASIIFASKRDPEGQENHCDWRYLSDVLQSLTAHC